jgi:hypothetical protein
VVSHTSAAAPAVALGSGARPLGRLCTVIAQRVQEEVLKKLQALQFSDEERTYFQLKVQKVKQEWTQNEQNLTNALILRLSHIKERLNRLTDAYLDQAIDQQTFEERKEALLMEQKDVEENLAQTKEKGQSVPDRLQAFLELAGGAYLQYKLGLPEQKRDLVKIISSNREVDGKNVDITLSFPFFEIENRLKKQTVARTVTYLELLTDCYSNFWSTLHKNQHLSQRLSITCFKYKLVPSEERLHNWPLRRIVSYKFKSAA